MTIKELMQKRDAIVTQMNAIVKKADEETRSLNTEESGKFDELNKELDELDKTIEAKRALESQAVSSEDEDDEPETRSQESVEEIETRAFEEYLRNYGETRATNMTKGDNGAVIPSSIANKIIEKVYEISPVLQQAERYNVKGSLSIPFYSDATDDITMTYAAEFTEGDSHSGKFTSIQLGGFLGRAICDVSKSLINNAQFDIVGFVVNHMATAIARFIEKELLIGTADYVEGMSTIGADMTVTANSKTDITAEELIDTQDKVPDVYQAGAVWIMNRTTRNKIRKLKDGEGNFILNRDLSSKWGYTLLGKDVYTSDNMPAIADGAKVIYYGDLTGLAVKVSEDINIEVLREAKARQHAVEVLGFVEFDSKIQNAQKLSQLKMKA